MFGAATKFDDPELAVALVEPLGPARIHEAASLSFTGLVALYGSDWGAEVFGAWTDARRQSWPESWLSRLPAMVGALHAEGGREGDALVRWIVDREVTRMRERLSRDVVSWEWPRPRIFDDLPDDVAALFEGAARLEDTTSVTPSVRVFTPPPEQE